MADDFDGVFGRPDVDALYTLDPSEFVAARNALAKELRAGADKDAATAVKELKRPTKAAWAINQVARSHTGAVADLLDAGATLRRRQADALTGGDASALREATGARREIVRLLVAEVVALIGDASRDDVAGTFEVASVDEGIGSIVSAGRLTTLPDRPSDMGFGGMPDPPARAPRRAPATTARGRRTATSEDAPPPPTRLDRKRIQKLERAVTAAERTAAEADDELADAERRLRRADDALTAAEAKRDDAAEVFERAQRANDAAAQSVAQALAELRRANDPS